MRTTIGFSAPSSSSTSSSPPPLSQTITHHPSISSHSAWHSPVPYLFGGLAAMLGLIAFALLILACSYWKLSGYLDSGEDSGDAQNGGGDDGDKEDEKPTFLATPISSRASSFGDNGGSVVDGESSNGDCNGDGGGGAEEKKMESLSAEEEQNSEVNDQNRHEAQGQ
ncbi:uncharacterized protein A4U43_C05F25650 [Asparagus officinalis]|uniref:Uncharacterized protein n=1 Tax=Asparagus officinalis TaxID=4686 RepID=A0A5P1EW15_ASPOF|nr:protein GLUTAMINE DUMPER 1 [Asparagus officinalis]ONK69683.1 uncharacterized protein A4U43_C05F25650 [Asparagus officinalis]